MEAFNQNVALFFKHPSDFDGGIGNHSTLYLLRRDTYQCFGYNPNNSEKINFQALFPATMAVMAGIDLLAKFLYSDSNNGVSKRFKDYVERYIDDNSKEELYQLRNSLIHSFGLYSEGKQGKIYRFILDRKGGLVNNLTGDLYVVNIDLLWEKFEKSINLYREDLIQNPSLQQTFMEMFPKYGTIGIGI